MCSRVVWRWFASAPTATASPSSWMWTRRSAGSAGCAQGAASGLQSPAECQAPVQARGCRGPRDRVPAEDRTRIFEPFHQSGRAPASVSPWPSSSWSRMAAGSGSRAKSAWAEHSASRSRWGRQRRSQTTSCRNRVAGDLVFIVEDKPENLELVRDVLQAQGHRTLEAGTAEDGIALAATQHPDLILLDILLPGMYGLE